MFHIPTAAFADEQNSPSEADIRRAIATSLPYIEKEGTDWIAKRACLSCHHVPFLLWSHNAALSRGIAVDEQKLAKWTDWSLAKSLSHRIWFRLSDKSLEGLKADAVPDAVLTKLKPLVDKPFTTEGELLAEAAKVLAENELAAHKPAIVKHAAVAKAGAVNDGGGLDTLGQLLLGRYKHGTNEKLPEFLAAAPALLAKWQEADGSWKSAGQLPARKWERPIADQTTTLWEVLALSSLDQPDPTTAKSLEQAVAFLKKNEPNKNTEWLAARLLFERRHGTSERVAELRKELIGRQNADGRWTWQPPGESDPFATGMVIYALSVSGLSREDAAIQKAIKQLLATQNGDGSWALPPEYISNTTNPDRLKRLEPIQRFWGTAWAVIGLAQTLPEGPPKTAKTETPFTAEAAKIAVLDFIRANPKAFEGNPDPERLAKLALQEVEPGIHTLGAFRFDVAKRRFSATIGNEDSFLIVYYGAFEEREGKWIAKITGEDRLRAK